MKNYHLSKVAIISALMFALPVMALAAPFEQDLKYGSKGDSVVALQEFLIDQGFFNGNATGNFYSLTLAAVRKFQKAQGISPISGYVGPITRGVINKILEDTSFDSEGDATVQVPVQNVPANQDQSIGIPVSIPVGNSVPVCKEVISLVVSGGDVAVRELWNTAPPYKYVESYTYVPKVTASCGSAWVVDYSYTAYSRNNLGELITVPDTGKIDAAGAFVNIKNPVVGNYQITFVAHTKDNTATSSSVTRSYTSHGLVNENGQ